MKISIDIDGTLLEHQKFFIALVTGAKEQGHEVGLLTARKGFQKEKVLLSLLNKGFPTFDFVLWQPIESTNGWTWKKEAIEKYNIDIHFEDFHESREGALREMGDHPKVIYIKNQ